MNFKILIMIIGLSILAFSVLQSEPSFNGSTPGCSGSGCHTLQNNNVTAVAIGNLQVEVHLSGVQAGQKMGGELVDLSGTVINVISSTSNNPFILTAPNAGKYIVNAGYKNPSRNWDSTMVDLTITTAVTNLPDNKISSYHLFQNYPNPFNPTTTIKYAIPNPGKVEITIFDALGQKVRTLLNEEKHAGNYEIVWDATNGNGEFVSSGIYIYQIKAGNFRATQKMFLMQ